MGSLGEILRSTREAKGITLQQAEEDTKIRKRYLQALEDENYEVIPGRVYAKGFLRNYARYLGLKQEEIMMEFKLLSLPPGKNGQETNLEASLSRRRYSARSERRAYLITVLVAVMAVLTLVVFNSIYKNVQNTGLNKAGRPPVIDRNGQDKPEDQTENQPVAESAYNPPAGQEEIPPAGTAAGNIKITLNGKDQVCWAKVTVDETVKFTGDINPGDSKEFTGAKKIVITLGNAGAVEVVKNGRSLGVLGNFGQVIKNKEFTPEDSAGQETETDRTSESGGTNETNRTSGT